MRPSGVATRLKAISAIVRGERRVVLGDARLGRARDRLHGAARRSFHGTMCRSASRPCPSRPSCVTSADVYTMRVPSWLKCGAATERVSPSSASKPNALPTTALAAAGSRAAARRPGSGCAPNVASSRGRTTRVGRRGSDTARRSAKPTPPWPALRGEYVGHDDAIARRPVRLREGLHAEPRLVEQPLGAGREVARALADRALLDRRDHVVPRPVIGERDRRAVRRRDVAADALHVARGHALGIVVLAAQVAPARAEDRAVADLRHGQRVDHALVADIEADQLARVRACTSDEVVAQYTILPRASTGAIRTLPRVPEGCPARAHVHAADRDRHSARRASAARAPSTCRAASPTSCASCTRRSSLTADAALEPDLPQVLAGERLEAKARPQPVAREERARRIARAELRLEHARARRAGSCPAAPNSSAAFAGGALPPSVSRIGAAGKSSQAAARRVRRRSRIGRVVRPARAAVRRRSGSSRDRPRLAAVRLVPWTTPRSRRTTPACQHATEPEVQCSPVDRGHRSGSVRAPLAIGSWTAGIGGDPIRRQRPTRAYSIVPRA